MHDLYARLCCGCRYLLHNKWETVNIIDQLAVPIQFVSGKQDKVINPRHMKTLCSTAMQSNDQVSFASLQGGHNDIPLVSGPVYQEVINKFIASIDAGPLEVGDDLEYDEDEEGDDTDSSEGSGGDGEGQDEGANNNNGGHGSENEKEVETSGTSTSTSTSTAKEGSATEAKTKDKDV